MPERFHIILQRSILHLKFLFFLENCFNSPIIYRLRLFRDHLGSVRSLCIELGLLVSQNAVELNYLHGIYRLGLRKNRLLVHGRELASVPIF